jgi:hypothetical protein
MILRGKISDEDLKLLNRRLLDYGRTENLPNFRIVWADDQFEKRKVDHTTEGFQLILPEVVEVPKYRQWIQAKYILERLTVVPQIAENDLIEKLSYEPVWVFEDNKGNALQPTWPAIHFVLEQLSYNVSRTGMTKYPDKGETDEEKQQRLNALQNELFGNESEVGDALAHKEGIVVPHGYSQSQ